MGCDGGLLAGDATAVKRADLWNGGAQDSS